MTDIAWISLTPLFAQGGGGGFFESLGILPLIVMIGALFYFMVLQPETKRRNDQEKMQQDMKKNDRVITIGGIHGVVTNVASDDEVIIRIDDKTDTKIRITRSAIQKVVNKDSGSET